MAKKILVVDDDSHIREYIENVLRDNGYETCSAGDGAQGIEVLKREKPDLITLDLEMPEEWGPRFYRKMSQLDEFKDTPVIVISGLSGIHLAIKRAVATLNKPFEPEKLLEIVRDTIGS